MHVTATDPYPWPYDGKLDGRTLVLLITGAQQAWTDISTGVDAATENIRTLSSSVRRAGGKVVAVRHLRCMPRGKGEPSDVPPRANSASAELLPQIADLSPDLVVECGGSDGLFAGPLEALLRAAGKSHVLLVGYASEITSDSTMRSLNDRGFECLVVTDALAPLDPALSARILDSVTKSGGIFGALGTTQHVCTALNQL